MSREGTKIKIEKLGVANEWELDRPAVSLVFIISSSQEAGGRLIGLVTFKGEIEQAVPAGCRHSLPFPDVLVSCVLCWSLWLLSCGWDN